MHCLSWALTPIRGGIGTPYILRYQCSSMWGTISTTWLRVRDMCQNSSRFERKPLPPRVNRCKATRNVLVVEIRDSNLLCGKRNRGIHWHIQFRRNPHPRRADLNWGGDKRNKGRSWYTRKKSKHKRCSTA